MAKSNTDIDNLHGLAQFALFVSSYLPLFILIIVRQVSENWEFLHWAGLSLEGFKIFALKFALSAIARSPEAETPRRQKLIIKLS